MKNWFLLIATGVLALACSAPAWAAPAQPREALPMAAAASDAGYAVRGSRLSYVGTVANLPLPGRYARELGSVTASVQLWTKDEVLDLRLTACTDTTCQPGGKPTRSYYRPVFEVFNRSTHALICSTAVTGALRCPYYGASVSAFDKVRIAPGRKTEFDLVYTAPYRFVFVDAGRGQYIYPVAGSASHKLNFTQARICSELGSTPWAVPALRAPLSVIGLMSFNIPPSPPTMAEIGDLAGYYSAIAARWWHHLAIRTEPGRAFASASPLFNNGNGVTVRLHP